VLTPKPLSIDPRAPKGQVLEGERVIGVFHERTGYYSESYSGGKTAEPIEEGKTLRTERLGQDGRSPPVLKEPGRVRF